MVTLEFSFSNSAIQASCAACWAVEPAPAISPEISPPPPPEVEPPVSLSLLDAHAATPRARARAKATTTTHLKLDISLPFGSFDIAGPQAPSGRCPACYFAVAKM